MIVDILFLIILVLYVFKGYRRGALVSLFAVVAIIIGVWGALRLSSRVAVYLADSFSPRWVLLISYVLVFFSIALGIRLCAIVLQKSLEYLALGVFNRIAGALLYGLIVCFAASSFFWLLSRLNIGAVDTLRAQSIVFNRLEPLAPYLFDLIGSVIPVIKDVFKDLSDVLDTIPVKI